MDDFVLMKRSPMLGTLCALGLAVVVGLASGLAADKKIVLVAGPPSHGPGEHEHRAGCLLLKACLDRVPGVQAIVADDGWPADPSIFNGAASIIVYSDGGDGHPFLKPGRLKVLGGLMEQGTGFGAIHYAVEVPKDNGGPEWLAWSGGYFEAYWSVNPTWEADFTKLPVHPITRGAQPFKIYDEWYFHMRFPEGMKNVTPILTAVPPDRTRGKPGANDAHGGNPEVQKHNGEPEHMMWAVERPGGARGFGFTGAHYHKNWSNNDFRKLMLNAILWSAKVEVPAGGVVSSVTDEMMKANLDPKGK